MTGDMRFAMTYFGIVQKRDDPEGIGRVRLEIPGLVELTGWAIPVGSPGGGKAGRGRIDPPALESIVLVGFEGGNREQPWYLPGGWPLGGAPEGHAVSDNAQNAVFADEKILIERDTRTGSSGYRIRFRSALGTDVLKIELDLETGQVEILGTTGIAINATGALRLNGATVQINSRPVMPTGKPI